MTIFRFCIQTRLVAGKCGVTPRIFDGCRPCSSSSSSGSSSSSDSEDERPTKREKPSSRESSVTAQTLVQQILSMKIDGSKLADGSSDVNVARPSGKWRKIKEDLNKQPAPLKLDPDLVLAVKDVASSLGGDPNITESELLKKLKDHDSASREIKSISEIFSGMKIERIPKKATADHGSHVSTEEDGLTAHMIAISSKKMWSVTDQEGDFSSSQGVSSARSKTFQETAGRSSGSDLFGAQPLNIFNQAATTVDAPKLVFPLLTTWDKLEARALKLNTTHPPANGFEEMIQWTEQGKLWKFPIDNEQGLEKEASIGFHEHVFLEKHIGDFPRKGPIRHFMELVLVGLSKNPYFTVEQKIEHIDWFRQYFKKHESLLKEIGALG